MQIPFTLMDVEGRKWTIPAEVINTKFPRHRFVVHKSLGLDDSTWMVSHFNTGGLVFYAGTKAAAIEGAQARLAMNKTHDLDRAIEACYAQRAEIITGQQMRLASSQKSDQAREEKTQAAAATRVAKDLDALATPVSHQAVA